MIAAVVVGGCDYKAAFERLAPKNEVVYGQQIIDSVRHRQFESIEPVLAPNIAGPPARQALERMASIFPAAEPKHIELIGVAVNVVNDTGFVSLVYEYEFPMQWLVADVVLRQKDGRQFVDGIHAQLTPDSQQHLNAIFGPAKTATHLFFLIWAVAAPIFIVFTLIAVFRMKGVPRRWLWAAFVALGFGQLTFNWTTSQVDIQLIRVTLFGAGFFKGYPYGPLLLFCSVPVGALVFWRKRRGWNVVAAQPSEETTRVDEEPRPLGDDGLRPS